MLTLLIGGVRSGKSSLAVRMGERQSAPVTFIATAEPFDDDLAHRIQRHRAERPSHWTTVECPVHLAAAIVGVPAHHFLVVDCLTVWLGNLFAHEVIPAFDAVVEALAHRTGDTVVVTNEVGMGVHPETALGRTYRDELGRLNQSIASLADTTLLMVAGRAVRLTDPWELLP
jgi:adenosyl cobinamide kinase/adenosyl cobinamide phosphate guanylyltransferase